jgi:hypothetical protein
MRLFSLLVLVFLPAILSAQIFIGFTENDSLKKPAADQTPDPDKSDYPFIDYKPAVIWNTPEDTVCDYAYIQRNFTDQMISVWNHPKRHYPASRVYALSMEGKYYRSAKVSERNYVFAEKAESGPMNLYLYRKIPQMNGWVEFYEQDTLHQGYTNFMIVDAEASRGKREYFGYFYDTGDGILKPVSARTLRKFADSLLTATPKAYALAMKYAENNVNKSRKIAVIGLMGMGFIGLALTGKSTASWIFLAGFPAGALVAFLNRPHTLHWQDMVQIIETYNKETSRVSPGK